MVLLFQLFILYQLRFLSDDRVVTEIYHAYNDTLSYRCKVITKDGLHH
jgi:hypothetical protein